MRFFLEHLFYRTPLELWLLLELCLTINIETLSCDLSELSLEIGRSLQNLANGSLKKVRGRREEGNLYSKIIKRVKHSVSIT